MDERISATEITVETAAQTMTILWADGHRSVYPLEGLRKACPCVECAGGHELMGMPPNPNLMKQSPTQTWTITRLEEVGNYAMQIYWGDGHNTGIYRWEYLRDLSPSG